MAEKPNIEWCDHTFNHVRGCTKVSAGCANCYAETMSKRNLKVLGQWGPNGTRVVASEAQWKEPLKWDRAAAKAGVRRRVFCASMADVFEDWRGPMVDANGAELNCQGWERWIGNPWYDPLTMAHVRERLGKLICETRNLDWLLLTKRPQNALDMMSDYMFGVDIKSGKPAIPPNLWLGTSIENQQTADERIPHLLKIPASVRFLSVEPLLGPVDLDDKAWFFPFGKFSPIHWVIVGGESGPSARPCNVEWIRSIVKQCRAAGVPCFTKQLGSWSYSANVRDALNAQGIGYFPPELRDTEVYNNDEYKFRIDFIDKKGGDPAEWPEDLRVREFPEVQRGN